MSKIKESTNIYGSRARDASDHYFRETIMQYERKPTSAALIAITASLTLIVNATVNPQLFAAGYNHIKIPSWL